jgi:two-component system, response regulator
LSEPDIVDILLVEDNPNDAELTLMALRENNVANSILHVKDGEEALEYVFCKGRYAERNFKIQPKLILLDLNLPKVNGIEVLKKIRSDDRTRAIPIVVLTSSKEERDIIDAYDLNVNSYIVKPVQFEEFMGVVRDLGMYWMVVNQSPRR